MVISNFDNMPDDVKKAVLYVFKTLSTRDKIIFLSKLKHNDLTYKSIGDMTGITFQRVQQLYDGYINMIRSTLTKNSNVLSGVIL